ncbi:MAG: alpha/beta hydrolase [Acidimicrobiia bacterium]
MEPLYDPALDAHADEARDYAAKVTSAVAGLSAETVAAARASYAPDSDLVRAGLNRNAYERSADGITVRIIEPASSPTAVYIDCHGGAFVMGNPAMNDTRNTRYVNAAGVVSVSIDYRLAPEHPYPAGPDDCERAAIWAIEYAAREWGTEQFFIAGQSAGANLAMATLLRLRDRHGVAPRCLGANLTYGPYDLSGTPSQIRMNRLAMRDLYLPHVGLADRQTPDISPLYADLSGLPPALFTVGTDDYLFDDNLFMAMRWNAAGLDTTLAVYPGCPHGFDAMPIALGRLATDRMVAWVSDRVTSRG